MPSYRSPILDSFTNEFRDVNLAFEANQHNFSLGYQETPEDMACAFRNYEDAMPLYPQSEWPDRFEENDKNDGEGWKYKRIVFPHDQNGEGTCVYNMAALMMQIMWNTQFGDDNALQFSPISGYRWNASGPQSGSNVGQSSLWCEDTGLLPSRGNINVEKFISLGYFKHTHPNVGWSNKFQEGWKESAKLFRVDEFFRLTSVEAWVSAQLNGFVCGGGRDSHAICHCGLALDGNSVFSIYCNSWGSWGNTLRISGGRALKSFGVDSKSKISTMVARDGWACRTTLRPAFMKKAA